MTLSAEVCHGFSDLFGTCHAVGVRQGWTFPSVVYARTAWTRWSSMTFSWASSRVLLAVALWIHHGPGSNHIMAKRHEITISWPYEVKSVVQLACMRSHGGSARRLWYYVYIYIWQCFRDVQSMSSWWVKCFLQMPFSFSYPVPDPEVRARWQGTSLDLAPKSPGCSEITGLWNLFAVMFEPG